MRLFAAFALVALGACSPDNASSSATDPTAAGRNVPAATVTIADTAVGACEIRWDGEAVTQSAFDQRAIQVLMDAIDRIGGPAAASLDNVPALRIEASATMRWPCAAPVIATLARSGYAQAWLRPSDAREAPDQVVQLASDDAPANPVRTITVGKGGAIREDGTLHDRAALREVARASATGGPDDFVVAPNGEASFGDVYQTLIDLRAGGAGVALKPAG